MPTIVTGWVFEFHVVIDHDKVKLEVVHKRQLQSKVNNLRITCKLKLAQMD